MKKILPLTLTLALCVLAAPLHAEMDPAAADALAEYFDFSEYGSGQITVEQIPADDYANFHILDVREAAQYEAEHIPGAHNIEWRQVFARRDELPRDQPILAYCNSGSLASQAALALRLDGFDNVKILYDGFDAYKAAQAAK